LSILQEEASQIKQDDEEETPDAMSPSHDKDHKSKIAGVSYVKHIKTLKMLYHQAMIRTTIAK
jgi:hypothetical protein